MQTRDIFLKGDTISSDIFYLIVIYGVRTIKKSFYTSQQNCRVDKKYPTFLM